jgi:hypothetical protein
MDAEEVRKTAADTAKDIRVTVDRYPDLPAVQRSMCFCAAAAVVVLGEIAASLIKINDRLEAQGTVNVHFHKDDGAV